VNAEQEKQIKKLMQETECDNDFRCYKLGFKNLCEARLVSEGQLVDCSKATADCCLREDPEQCSHRVAFGFGHFCNCPLRVYAAEHLGS